MKAAIDLGVRLSTGRYGCEQLKNIKFDDKCAYLVCDPTFWELNRFLNSLQIVLNDLQAWLLARFNAQRISTDIQQKLKKISISMKIGKSRRYDADTP